ncbi:MAG: EamA family transporter [bacterium]
MSWYIFAFIAPLLWAISNHIDKYILGRYLKNTNAGILAIFAGMVGFLFSLSILIFSPYNILGIGLFNGVLIVLNGVLLVIAYIPYYYAINGEDASSVVPLYQIIPIFSFVLGYIFLWESISLMQIISGLLIIIGSVLISIDFRKSKVFFKGRVLALMAISSFLISVHFLIFKIVAIQENFWRTVFWEYLGAVGVALFLLVFISKYRLQFIALLRENSLAIILVNLLNETVNIGAKLFANYATLLVPVVIVNLANGIQPLFVFIIGIILTIFLPFINKEKITKIYIIQRLVAIIILFVGTYLLII